MTERRRKRRIWAFTNPEPIKTPGARSAEINVTPLVDVVLVLLLIFMVVTPVLHRDTAINLPAARHASDVPQEGERLTITVASDGTIHLEGRAASIPELAQQLAAAKLGPNSLIYVRGDRQLHFRSIRELLQQIHQGGKARVALGTSDPDQVEGQ